MSAWVRNVILAALLVAVFLPGAAYAACTNPTGVDGVMIYNGDAHIPQYCNSVTWVAMATTPNVPTTNGLAGYWKLDEGSGTSVADSSGNANTGTVGTGGTLTTGGYYNGAVSFAGGSNNNVAVPDIAALDFSGSWTLSAWVNSSTLPGSAINAMIVQRNTSASKTAFELMLDHHQSCSSSGQSWRVSFQDSGGTQNKACFAATVNTGTWYHVVGVWDASSSNLMVYLNGSLVVTQNTGASVPVTSSGSGLKVGSDSGGTSRWNGMIDDVRLYNRALSAAEITTLYNWHVSPPSSGLVARWKFDESGGTTALDSSGNSNTGTLTNGPTFTSAGKLGGAVSLDGTNDYVDAGNPASLQITGSFTLASWVYISSFPGADDNAVISKEGAAANTCAFGMNVTRDNGPEQFYVFASPTGACSTGANHGQRYNSTTLVTGQWYYLTGVYDAAMQTLHAYLNGVPNDGTLGGTVPSTVYNTTGSLKIGTRIDATMFFFNGKLDDARVYNRALSADEIYGLYRTSSPVCSSPSGYEGEVMYNAGSNHVLQFCDNTSWRPLGPVPGAGGGGCSSPSGSEGDTIYSDSAKGSGVMQYCDGTKWIQMGGPTIPTSGLLGYWKMDDGSGTTTADSSGGGNAGTLVNGPTWTTAGKDAGAVSFDGTNDYVTMGNVTSMNALSAMTVSAWIKSSSAGANPSESHIVNKSNCSGASTDGPFELGVSMFVTGKAQFVPYKNGAGVIGNASNASITNVDDGKWHFLTGQWDGAGNVLLWVDGILETTYASSAGALNNTTKVVAVGDCAAGGGYFYHGAIDDVRVYNRALSAQEIWQLYSGT